jgi:hypothetical protein
MFERQFGSESRFGGPEKYKYNIDRPRGYARVLAAAIPDGNDIDGHAGNWRFSTRISSLVGDMRACKVFNILV